MSLLTRLISSLGWRLRFAVTHRAALDPTQRIQLLPDGLEIIDIWNRKISGHLCWRDVKEIITYKIDAYITDTICIGFRTRDEHDYFGVHENMENWNLLCDHLRSEFSIDWPTCYAHIVHPPFATNRTTIWGTPLPLPCPKCNYDLRGSPRICPECGRPVDPPALLPPSNEQSGSIVHPPRPR